MNISKCNAFFAVFEFEAKQQIISEGNPADCAQVLMGYGLPPPKEDLNLWKGSAFSFVDGPLVGGFKQNSSQSL
jgi:hypothetical protein